MEFAARWELFEWICNAERFSEDEARYFFQQLISGVSYCHHLQICHRDLKLENTLLDGSPASRLKICNFGYLKSSLLHSRPKSMIGTSAYITPEVLSRQEYDGKISSLSKSIRVLADIEDPIGRILKRTEIDENVARKTSNHRSLRHPNIIRFKEVVLTPTHLPIVMEFAARGSCLSGYVMPGGSARTRRDISSGSSSLELATAITCTIGLLKLQDHFPWPISRARQCKLPGDNMMLCLSQLHAYKDRHLLPQ